MDDKQLLIEWGEMKSRLHRMNAAIAELMERKKIAMDVFVAANSPLRRGDIVRVGIGNQTIRATVLEIKPDFTLVNSIEWEVRLVTERQSGAALDKTSQPFLKRLRLGKDGYEWYGGLVKKLEIMGA